MQFLVTEVNGNIVAVYKVVRVEGLGGRIVFVPSGRRARVGKEKR